MATHSSVLAWRIPGTAEPGGLPSLGSHRVRHDWSNLVAVAAAAAAGYICPCWLKGCTTWELWVKFYLGQNEDCSLGGSPSDSSERLLQRGRGEQSVYKILVKGEFSAIKCLLCKRFSASYEDLISWRNLMLIWIWGDARIVITNSVPKNIQLSKDLSHQIPWSTECLTPPWTPSVGIEGQ